MQREPLLIGVDASSLISMNPRGEGKSLLRLYQEIVRQRPEWQTIFYGQSSTLINKNVGVSNCTLKYFSLPGHKFNSWLHIGLPFHAWYDKVDLLHCSSTFVPFFSANPNVLTVHDIIPLVSTSNFSEHQKKRFRDSLARSLSKAKVVISVSQSTKDDLIRLFPVNPEKIKVIHWGCDEVDQVKDGEDDNRSLEKLNINKPYVMAFGGDIPRKNTLRILEAFKLFTDNVSTVSLVLIGINSNKLHESLLSECGDLGISEKVVLLPYISEPELALLYRKTDCLLYPSLYEGFGMPLLEAMASGVSIITSKTSSMPEVLGDAGLLVDPYNTLEISQALERMVTEKGLKERCQIASKQRAQKFTWKKTAEEYITVFEQLV